MAELPNVFCERSGRFSYSGMVLRRRPQPCERNRSTLITLGVHSTTPSLGVALVEDGCVREEVIFPPSREHLENLAVAVKDLMERQGVTLADLGGIGVATGPGSFSGIRVGLSLAKGIALALGIPVAGVSTLEILAWQALDNGSVALPVIDARRGEVYTGLYRKQGAQLTVIDGPMLIPLDALVRMLKKVTEPITLCGDRVADGEVTDFPLVVRSAVRVPSPAVCAKIAEQSIRAGRSQGLHGILPLYIRRSDAEENRERRLAERIGSRSEPN